MLSLTQAVEVLSTRESVARLTGRELRALQSLVQRELEERERMEVLSRRVEASR